MKKLVAAFCGLLLVVSDFPVESQGKKTKCFSIPTFPMKVENVIKACQDEVKTNLIEDLLFAAFNENPFDNAKHQHVLKEFEDHIFDGHHPSPHHHHPDIHNLPPHHPDIHHLPPHHSDIHHSPPHHPDGHHSPPHHSDVHHSPPHHSDVHHSPPHHSGIHHLPPHHPDGHHFQPLQIDPHHYKAHHIDPHSTHLGHLNPHHSDPHHLPIYESNHPLPHSDHHYPLPDPHNHPLPDQTLPLQISIPDHTAHHSLPDHLVNTHAVKSINHHPIVPVETYNPHLPAQPVFEAHHELTQVFGLKKSADTHDNHQHISAILEKLRNNNTNSKDDSSLMWHRRISKRSLLGTWTTKKPDADVYHPTVITHEDRWLAGCLMQCVYRKNNAVDDHGYPTLDGLTDLYTAGTTEQAFFVHVLRSVDKCLKSASIKHKIHKGKVPVKGETCDVAFDVFDCVSDSITEYCS